MSEPTTLQAGDTIAWSTTIEGATPADGWTLNYRILWPSGREPVEITAAADGDGYRVDVAASASADWPAAMATLVSWVAKGAERRTIARRPLQILPDLASAAAFDSRSANAQALAAAEAALAAYVMGGKAHVAEYEIDGKRMRFRSTAEITDLIAYYRARVAKENAGAVLLAGGTPGRVNVRM